MIPTVYKGSDRWYYTAVLSNPNSGDVAEQPARFYDQRTVPLLDETAGYCAALTKLTIQGSAANLPILVPPIQAKTSAAGTPYMYTGYMLGVRYLATNAGLPGQYAISEMQVAQLRIPSAYPTDSRDDTSGKSKFYWVTSQNDVCTAINTALADAFTINANRTVKFTAYGGTGILSGASTTTTSTAFNWSTLPSADAAPSPFAVALNNTSHNTSSLRKVFACANGQFPTDTGITVASAPFPAGTNIRAYVYFNDKLLEAVPFDTLYDYFADGASGTFPVPWVEKTVPYAQFSSSNKELTSSSSPQPDLYALANPSAKAGYMYPVAWTYSHGQVDIPSAMTSALRQPAWLQENAATSNWTFFTGLAVASGSLPAFPTSIGVNTIASASSGIFASAQTNSSNIIFEANLPSDAENLYQLQNGFEFQPQHLQWQRLKPGTRLSTMDFQLYLRTRTGEYVPWSITNGGTITMQLAVSTDPW